MCSTVLYCTVLYCTVLCNTVLYYTVLYLLCSIVLYLLCSTVLYDTVQCGLWTVDFIDLIGIRYYSGFTRQ